MATLQIRIDDTLKKQADTLFSSLGLDTSTAIRIFLNRMKKDVKLMKKRGKDIGKLTNVLSLLASGEPLPVQYRDHSLSGNLRDYARSFSFGT